MYTNHCVRETAIAHLKRAGVSDRQICSVSGHKNVQSLAYDKPSISDSVSMAATIDRKPSTCDSAMSALPVMNATTSK